LALLIKTCTPGHFSVDGGGLFTLTGVFPVNEPILVKFSAGGESATAYSGHPGQANDLYAQGTLLTGVFPKLTGALASASSLALQVDSRATGETAFFAQPIGVNQPVYDSQTYSLRSLFAPQYATGPRSLQEQQSWVTPPGALLEHLLATAGQMLSQFGGVRVTWLTADVAANDAMFHVKHLADFAPTGTVLVDNTLYHYTGKSGDALTGVYAIISGVRKDGAVGGHLSGDAVTDLSSAYSQLDALHNSYFIATAQGNDLSVCGRNYGLSRDPSISDDATYAKALEAIAYGPRGTILGLRTALDAMLGAGQYTLSEDTQKHPCTVFIGAPHQALLLASALGKSYPSGPSFALSTNANTLSAPAYTQSVYSVTQKPQDVATDCSQQLPSAAGFWGFSNGQESSDVAVVADAPGLGRCAWQSTDGYYVAVMPADPKASINLSLTLRSEGSPAAGQTSFGAGFSDGRSFYGVSVQAGSGQIFLAICDATGATLGLAGAALAARALLDVDIRKLPTGDLAVTVNGRPYLSMPQLALGASTQTRAVFGFAYGTSATSALFGVQKVRLLVQPGRNYWQAQSGSASVSAQQITTPETLFVSQDVGSIVRISNSSASVKPPGYIAGPLGSNNGAYQIVSVDAPGSVNVKVFSRGDGVVGASSTYTNQLDFPSAVFHYPRDIGRRVTLTSSQSNNGGVFYVASLLNPPAGPQTLPYERRCTSALLVRADGSTPSFVSQASVPVLVVPMFASEGNLDWSLDDAGLLTAGASQDTVTTRQPLPGGVTEFQILANDVLGCQVVDSEVPVAFKIDDGPPPIYSAYPLYVADPFAYVGNYVNQLTAAGVRAVFSVS
jgi:hypothetical protein